MIYFHLRPTSLHTHSFNRLPRIFYDFLNPPGSVPLRSERFVYNMQTAETYVSGGERMVWKAPTVVEPPLLARKVHVAFPKDVIVSTARGLSANVSMSASQC